MSVVGTTIFKMDGNAYYSPEFRRGGLAATFVMDAINLIGGPTVSVTVEHRNADETAFGNIGTLATVTSTGVKEADISGLKEILRFKYEFDAGDDATDGMHFLMMAPSWRPYS